MRENALAAKKITILFLPDGSSRTRQLKIPKAAFMFSCIVLLGLGIGLAYLIRDYWVIKKQMPQLTGLEEENRAKNVQLVTLARKINRISEDLVKSKAFVNQLRVMTNVETSEDNTQLLGVGGSDPALLDPAFIRDQGHRKLVRKMHQSLDDLDTEISLQAKDMTELSRYLKNQKSMLTSTPSIWPARGWISSRFGYRISPFTNKKEFHRGLDICTKMGSPIIASADGIVTSAKKDYGYGNIITLNHHHGLKTRYAHLKKFLVKKGQSVKRGDKIGLVGLTGRTTGPHLHYEVHLNGVPVDPLRYILN